MKLYQVDAFSKEIFKGNPAGVCIVPAGKIDDEKFMQNLAAEMNLSETAYVCKVGDGYRLRWFTPTTEVSLCGHATLSAAHIMWETGLEQRSETIVFNTLSGIIPVNYRQDKIELNFPRYEVEKISDREDINEALGIKPVFTGSDKKEYLLEVDNFKVLKGIQPDYAKLSVLGHTAFIVTCKSNETEYDFYSRFFAPAVGINEDPVTGSAHSRLAPYWAKKLGKRKITGYQASQRGGVVECELKDNLRVLIRGYARTVFEIEMRD